MQRMEIARDAKILRQFVSGIYLYHLAKFGRIAFVTYVCEDGQRCKMQNLQRVSNNEGPFFGVCDTKFV